MFLTVTNRYGGYLDYPYGIMATNHGTDLAIISSGDVESTGTGIHARNYGSGTLSILTSGGVTGGNGYAISTTTGAGGTTQITLDSGTDVSATFGLAISNDAGDSTTNINTGATVTGEIRLSDGSDDVIAAGDISGVTVLDGGDDTSTADGFIDKLTFSGQMAAFTGAIFLNWEEIELDDSVVSFSDGMLVAGDGSAGTGLSLINNSILSFDGTFDLTGNLSLASGTILNGVNGTAGDAFNVSGDFTGGGIFTIDVDFATSTADTLNVAGSVTGDPTTIVVADATTGDAAEEDVDVVRVIGTTSAGDFVLDGSPIVSGANFLEYDLALQGSTWILGYQGQTLLPTTPTYNSLASLLDLTGLRSLQERLGAQQQAGGGIQGGSGGTQTNQLNTNLGAGPTRLHPLWVSIEGSSSDITPIFSTTSSSYDVNQWKIQGGIQGQIMEAPHGLLVGGLSLHYGRVSADVTSALGNGGLSTTASGIGSSVTWYGDSGLYFDWQTEFSWFDTDVSAVGTAGVRGVDGTGFATSLEVGKRFVLADGIGVTPQMQLSYGKIGLDNFMGPFGEVVTSDDLKSKRARFGVSFDKEYGNTGLIYGIVNVAHEFNDQIVVDVSGTKLTSVVDDWTGEIGVGGSYQANGGAQRFFGQVTARTGLDNFGDSTTVRGTLGMEIKF